MIGNTLIEREKEIEEYELLLDRLKGQKESCMDFEEVQILAIEKKIDSLKEDMTSSLTPWQRVLICRHKDRPHSSTVLEQITDEFIPLHGDRTFGEDQAIIGGLALIGGKRFVVIAQEKGRDTEQRIKHNFGMPQPEGYRKAYRLMELAEKFGVPVLTLIDTPGAYPGLAAEERGQGWAIAKNLWKMAQLKTPIISIIIGEGCSGGALGIGMGDRIGMLEHAYYSVISPEGCASILFNDPSKKNHTAEILKMHAEHLQEIHVIDEIIKEPLGGAHKNPKLVCQHIKEYVLDTANELSKLSLAELVEFRYERFRNLGSFNDTSVE